MCIIYVYTYLSKYIYLNKSLYLSIYLYPNKYIYIYTPTPNHSTPQQATAAECIRHLREQRVGVADFIPLQGIREKVRRDVFMCNYINILQCVRDNTGAKQIDN